MVKIQQDVSATPSFDPDAQLALARATRSVVEKLERRVLLSANDPAVTINQTPAAFADLTTRLFEEGYLASASASTADVEAALRLYRSSIDADTDQAPSDFQSEVSFRAQEFLNSVDGPSWQEFTGPNAASSGTADWATSWMTGTLAGAFASATPITLESLSVRAGEGTSPGHSLGRGQTGGMSATFRLNGASASQTGDFVAALQSAAQAIDPTLRLGLVVVDGSAAAADINARPGLEADGGTDLAFTSDPGNGAAIPSGELYVELRPPRLGNPIADFEQQELGNILSALRLFGDALTDQAAAFVQQLAGDLNPGADPFSGLYSGIPFVDEKLDDIADLGRSLQRIAGSVLEPAEVRGVAAVAGYPTSEADFVLEVDAGGPVAVTIPASSSAGNLVSNANSALAAAGLGDRVEAFVDGGVFGFRTADPTGTLGLPQTLAVSTPRLEATSDAPQYGQPGADVSIDLILSTRDDAGTLVTNTAVTLTVPESAAGAFGSEDNITVADLAEDLNAALVGLPLDSAAPDAQRLGLLADDLVFVAVGDRLELLATNPLLARIEVQNGTALGFAAGGQATDTAEAARTSLGLVPDRAIAEPAYQDVPQLMAALADALGVDEFGGSAGALNWEYDESRRSLLLTLALEEEFGESVELDFTDGLDLGGVATLQVSGTAGADATATLGASLRLGLFLGAFSETLPTTFGPGTPLSVLNDGQGVPILTGVVAQDPPPGGEVLLFDTTLVIEVDGSTTFNVPINAIDTVDNTTRAGLVGDVNAALVAAGLDDRFIAVLNNDPGGTLDDHVAIYSVDPAIGAITSVTGGLALGIATGQGDDGTDGTTFTDLVIGLDATPGDMMPDAVYNVTLSRATTLGDVAAAISAQTAGNVTVGYDADAARLILDAGAGTQVTVLPGNYNDDPTTVDDPTTLSIEGDEGIDSPAGVALGILGQSDGSIPDNDPALGGVLNGLDVTGKALLDRIFIDEAAGPNLSVSLGVSADPGDLSLGASVGLAALTLSNPDAFGFDLSASLSLQDPGIGDADDGQIFLSEIVALSDAGDLFNLSGAIVADLEGCLELSGNIGPSLGGTLGQVCFSLSDPSNPLSIQVDPQLDFGNLLEQIQNFSLPDLIGAARSFLLELPNLAGDVLDVELPLVDVRLGEIIDAGEFVLDQLSNLAGLDVDLPTLEGLGLDLRSAIVNLQVDLDVKVDLLELVTEFNAALDAPDLLAGAGRMLAIIEQLRLRIPDLPTLDGAAVQVGELEFVLDTLTANLPAFDLPALSAKLEAALNGAWPLGGNPFGVEFDLVDIDASLPGQQLAVVGSVSVAYELDPIDFDPMLPTGTFGPVELVADADFALRAGAELVIGFGASLDPDAGVAAFLITDDPTASGRTTRLDITAGFQGDFNGGVQFGALEADLVSAAAEAGLTDARSVDGLSVSGGNVTLPEAVLDDEPGFVFVYPAGSTTPIDPANYTLSGTTLSFTSGAPSSVDVVYRPASATSVVTPADRASISLTLAEAPDAGNDFGGVAIGDAFGSGIDADIDGIATASADATFLGNTLQNAVIVAADLNNLLDGGTNALRVEVDDEGLLELFTDIDFDFKAIVQAIDTFLDLLESALEDDIFEELPLVGGGVDAAETFVGTLREQITQPLLELLTSSAVQGTFDQVEATVRSFLYQQLGQPGADILKKLGNPALDAGDNPADILVELTEETFEIGLRIAGTDTIAGVDFSSGLDGFPLSADGGLALTFDYDVFVGLGVDRVSGAYLTPDPLGDAEYELGLVAGLAVDTAGATPEPTSFELDLFGLKFTATDNNVGETPGTGIFGDLNIDLASGALTGGRLPIGDLLNDFLNSFDVTANLDAKLDVELDLGINESFPSVAADVVGEFGIELGFSGGDVTFEVGNNASIGFQDVRLELGSFISNIIGEPVRQVAQLLEPVAPLIEILNTEVPGVSQISQIAGKGPVTVLDLALIQNPDTAETTKKFLAVVETVLEIAELIGENNGEVAIVFGSFGFGPLYDNSGLDPRLPGVAASASSDLEANGVAGFFDAAKEVLDSGNNAVSDLFSTINSDASAGDAEDGGLGINLDFLEPANIFRFLLGDTVNIITWDIPRFALTFEWSKTFPIWSPPPINVELGLGFEAFVDLAVGFDTRGLQTGNFFDGFFLSDLDLNTGEDIAEFGLVLSASLGVSVGFPGLKAGVRGTLLGEVDFNFRDPDDDGKMYVDEIIGIVSTDGLDCLFDIEARIRIVLSVFWEVLFVKGSADLLDEVLLSADNSGNCPKLVPATLVETTGQLTYDGNDVQAGTLVIHTGEFADLRGGGASDTSEAVTVTEVAPGVIQVSVLDIIAGYTGVQRILFDGGAGNDLLELADLTDGSFDLPVIANGGAGNDTLNGSTVDDTLIGGTGNDLITTDTGTHDVDAGSGNDTVVALGGNDTVLGGPGADLLEVGNGNNVVGAGSGNDTITAGSGNDDIDGGAGADTITAAAGNDTVDAGSGNDTVIAGSGDDSVLGGAGRDSIRAQGGNDFVDAGGGRDYIDASTGNDTVLGGSGSDEIFGRDGNDSIIAGAGNDLVEAGEGDDYVDAGLDNDFVLGQAGQDTILGNWGNDVLLANAVGFPDSDSGEHLEGGPGDDFICGGSEGDFISGGSTDAFLAEVVSVGTFDDVTGELTASNAPGGWAAVDCSTEPTVIEVEPGTATIRVGLDGDLNGSFTGGEGLAGVLVRLLDPDGVPVAVATTDASGLAVFEDVEPGSYQAEQVVPDDLFQFVPASGETVPLDLEEGGDELVTLLNREYARITGVKFNDIDRDGHRDQGEPLLANWSIRARPADPSDPLPTYITTTDSAGRYTFESVIPGEYIVEEFVQPGWFQTFPDNGVPTYFQTFNNDEEFPEWDRASQFFAPSIPGQGLLGVYGNERVEAQLPVPVPHTAVTIEFDLYIIGDWGGSEENGLPFGLDGDFWSASVLSSQGVVSEEYTFSNLNLGGPAQFRQTYPQTVDEVVALNFPGEGRNAQDQLGFSFIVSDREIELTDARYRLSYTIPHSSPILQLAFEGRGLENILGGNFDSPVAQLEGWAIDNVRVTTLGQAHLVDAVSGQAAGDFDFGNTRATGDVTGQVRRDDNGNGLFDGNDYPINGQTVRLVDPATGDVLANATTGPIDLNEDGLIDPYTEQGQYRFVGVAPGPYVVEMGPSVSSFSPASSNVNVVAFAQTPASFLRLVDPTSVSGFTFEDLDRDGVRDPGEPGLPANLFLDLPSGNDAVGDGVAGTYDRAFSYSSTQNFRPGESLIDVTGVIGQLQDFTLDLDLTVRNSGSSAGPVTLQADLFGPSGDDISLFQFQVDTTGQTRLEFSLSDAAATPVPTGTVSGLTGTFLADDNLSDLVGLGLTGQWFIEFSFSDPDAVTVNSWTLNTTVLEPTRTASPGGFYTFTDLAPALFRVFQQPVTDLELIRPGAGDNSYLLRSLDGRNFTDIDFANAEPESTLPGDANGDGTVNLSDFLILRRNFGTNPQDGAASGDFNGDGTVNLSDFLILRRNFGQSQDTPPPAESSDRGTGSSAATSGAAGANLGSRGGSFGSSIVMVGNVSSSHQGPFRIATAVPSEGLTKGPRGAESLTALRGPRDLPDDLFPAPRRTVIDFTNGTLFQIDLETGVLTEPRQAVTNVIGIALEPAVEVGPDEAPPPRQFVGIDTTGRLLEIDPDTGATLLGPQVFAADFDLIDNPQVAITLEFDEGALDFVPAEDPARPGRLMAALPVNLGLDVPVWFLMEIDPETGAATLVAPIVETINGDPIGSPRDVSALAFDGRGRGVVLTDSALLEFDLDQPVPEFTNAFPRGTEIPWGGVRVAGMDFTPDRERLFITFAAAGTNNGQLWVARELGSPSASLDFVADTSTDPSGLELENQSWGFRDGSDTIDAQAGDDIVIGDHDIASEPRLVPDGMPDTLLGGEGNDELDGQFDDDRLVGGADRSADDADPNEGNDTLIGGEGTDLVFLAVDNNVTLDDNFIDGQGFDELVEVETAWIVGGSDGNSLNASSFTLGSVTLIGGDGDDELIGGTRDDSLAGGAGDDNLFGGDGSDFYRFDTPVGTENEFIDDTGVGTDTVDFSGVNSGLSIDLSNPNFVTGLTLNITAAPGTVLENVVGTPFDDEIFGNSESNIITGNAGNDTILGGDGNDLYIFRPEDGIQDDVVFDAPGQGVDSLDFSQISRDTPVVVQLDDPGNLASYGLNTVFDPDGVTEIENVLGTPGDDVFVDNDRNNFFIGDRGDDTYIFNPNPGGASDVILEDALLSAGNDTLDLSRATAGYAVDLTVTNLAVGGPHVVLAAALSIENVIGSQGPDTIRGTDLANRIDGQAGDDSITAAGGADTLTGGFGSDTVSGGFGSDLFVFVDLSASGIAETDTLFDDGGVDTLDFSQLGQGVNVIIDPARPGTLLAGTGGGLLQVEDPAKARYEQVIGTDFNDLFQGSPEADTLIGGEGNDIFIDGDGDDLLDGGPGDDGYIFNTSGDFQLDQIIDVAGGRNLLGIGSETVGVTIDISDDFDSLIAVGNDRYLFGTGTHFADVATGVGNDFITGNRLSNNIFSGDGDDTVLAGRAADAVFIAGGSKLIEGGAGDDNYIFQGDADVRLVESDGSVAPGTGIARGGGFDILDLGFATNPVEFDLSLVSQAFNAGGSSVELFAPDPAGGPDVPDAENFEGLFGSRTAQNVLTGNSRGNLLVGGAADDTLSAFDGTGNLVVGQGGNDGLLGSLGDDILLGGDGDDTLVAGPGRDILIGGRGADGLTQFFFGAGETDEDILIAGSTTYGDILNAMTGPADLLPGFAAADARRDLTAIAGRWGRTDLTFDDRRLAIAAGLGTSGAAFNASTITTDGAIDSLIGDGGRDWLLRESTDLDDEDPQDFRDIL
jgi:Ca2+-binding RTX toxin-like protein